MSPHVDPGSGGRQSHSHTHTEPDDNHDREHHHDHDLADEDAERVAGGIGEDHDRLVRVGPAVLDLPGTELERPCAVPLELRGVLDDEVEVELLVHLGARPGRARQVLGRLERESLTVGRDEDEELPVVLPARLVTLAVRPPQERAVELRESAMVLRVEHGGAEAGERLLFHPPSLPPDDRPVSPAGGPDTLLLR